MALCISIQHELAWLSVSDRSKLHLTESVPLCPGDTPLAPCTQPLPA